MVIKIGTSALVDDQGEPSRKVFRSIAAQVAAVGRLGTDVVLVSSGAIAAGLGPLGLARRPTDMPTLQAAAAVGQRRLMDMYADSFKAHQITVGQVLLTRQDIVARKNYLNARNTIERLLQLGCLPIVNENDTVAVEEIRYGDNDRLAALVCNVIKADLLIMLSDVDGFYDGKPPNDAARVVERVEEVTDEMVRATRGRSSLGSGGMSTKLEAARMATLSGVAAVIARAARPKVVSDICSGVSVGTYFVPRKDRIAARKLWIAWAPTVRGRVIVDDGAVAAIVGGRKSLLTAGVSAVEGSFEPGDAIDVVDGSGRIIGRGLVNYDSRGLGEFLGRRGEREVIHRDHLVVL